MSDWLMAEHPAVATRLSHYRLRGERTAKGCCPNSERHRRGDKSPSLLLKLADNGGLIFRCLSGCDKPSILAAMGLKWRDICFDRPVDPRLRGQVAQIVKTYQYQTPDGQDAFQVVRYHPKTFRPRRLVPSLGPDWCYEMLGAPVKRVEDRYERSGWKWIGADGKRHGDQPGPGERAIAPAELWPYNAHLLHVTADTGKIAWWVEGEKDCDALLKLGMIATTTSGGAAGRFFDRRCASLFRGRHVIFLPDNDQAGKEYSRFYLGCCVDARAASVAILHLPKQPEKGDVSDWIFRNKRNPNDDGPNSQPANLLKQLVKKLGGYGRKEIGQLFAKK